MKSIIILGAALAAQAAVLDQNKAHEKRQGAAIGAGLMSFVMSSAGKTPKPSVKVNTLKAELFPKATRKQTVWGPFTLQPTNGEHKNQGLKLDKQSDVIEEALSGLCTNCMVLQAKAEITDKDGKHLDMKSEVYTHHIIVANLGRMMVLPPLTQGASTCPGGAMGSLMGGMSGGSMGGMGMGSPKSPSSSGNSSKPKGGMAGMSHGHARRQAPTPPAKGAEPAKGAASGGLLGLLGPMMSALTGGKSSGIKGFSIFIGKGNEGDSSIYAPVNNTSLKSGYWLGIDDKITATAEVVNYKNVPQDVYLSIDAEYMPMNGTRPMDWMDVGFGAIQIEQCGALYLVPAKDKMTTFTSSEWTANQNGYLINMSPHLHDGALNMKIYLNGAVVCQSDAVYGEDGGTSVNGQKWETITSYSPCLDPIKVRPGDKVKMTSDYDLTKHRLRPDSREAGAEAEAMAIGNYQFAQALKGTY